MTTKPGDPPIDVYFSVDIETDGPTPGHYSMLSCGLVVAGTFDGDVYTDLSGAGLLHYAELVPVSPRFDPEALAVSGLDRTRLYDEGSEPAVACAAMASWIEDTAQGMDINSTRVFVGYPVTFDWMFMRWYFEEFAIRWPFGHAGQLDIKTMYATRKRIPVSLATRSDMPPELLSEGSQDHHALADALSQAQLFSRVFGWNP